MAAVACSPSAYSLPSTSTSTMSAPIRGAQLDAPSARASSRFALAQVKGAVCLVQMTNAAPASMSSALMVSDVDIFRHEFITLFRYSHSATVHPADLHILEPVDERCMRYEEEKGTVFLARDVMDRMQKFTRDSRMSHLPARQRRTSHLLRMR